MDASLQRAEHFLDAFRRVGGVCVRRHLACASEAVEKGKGLLSTERRLQGGKKQFVLLQPSSIGVVVQDRAFVYDTQDIGRMAQWTLTKGF